MWISKNKLREMLDHQYTRGWNHAHLPPRDYQEWADKLKTKGIPDYIVNAFKEED
uniref:Uncharacterized protein n=1 Tax=viral metagenome TaxID=1070528 RepID=A0A6M3KB76_9ZZZZ